MSKVQKAPGEELVNLAGLECDVGSKPVPRTAPHFLIITCTTSSFAPIYSPVHSLLHQEQKKSGMPGQAQGAGAAGVKTGNEAQQGGKGRG